MLWWMLAGLAFADECDMVSKGRLARTEAPAVIVVGMPAASVADGARVHGLIRRLLAAEPVTVAIEQIPASKQPVLDVFATGDAYASDLPELLDWSHAWSHSWRVVEPLATASALGARVVAAGPDGVLPSEDAGVRVPPRYADLFRDDVGESPMPLSQEQQFVLSMAHTDHAIAQAALAGWDEKGFLVIVAGRTRVEGGLGVAWQAEQLTPHDVQSVIVGAPDPAYCGPDDRYLK